MKHLSIIMTTAVLVFTLQAKSDTPNDPTPGEKIDQAQDQYFEPLDTEGERNPGPILQHGYGRICRREIDFINEHCVMLVPRQLGTRCSCPDFIGRVTAH